MSTANQPIIVTAEGLQKLKDELDYLKTTRRQEVADRLKEAISYGDLSENSEYQEAKEEQAFLEGKIIELEKTIKTVQVAKGDNRKTVIHLGSVVTLELDKKQITVTLVGATEAEPFEGKISNESPLGKAISGAKKGDVVEVDAPSGKLSYTVIDLK
jgi:transcription elongation factor GreA